jgi:hypothetical protein
METRDDSLLFMEHFIKHSMLTKYRPIPITPAGQSLIIFFLRVFELSKETGMVLLSFRPHTTNKL